MDEEQGELTEAICPHIKHVEQMTGHMITDAGVSDVAVFMFVADLPCPGGHVHADEMIMASFTDDALHEMYELIEKVLARR